MRSARRSQTESERADGYMALMNIQPGFLVVQRGQPRSTSVTIVPPGGPPAPPWSFIETQILGFDGISGAEVLCSSYRYAVGDQGGIVLDANIAAGWVQGLESATFVLNVFGDGWAEATVKLTTFQ